MILTNPITAQPDINGDYGSVNSQKSFPIMERIITQDIAIVDDSIAENTEAFFVQIGRQTQETDVDVTMDSCIVTIIDDDCEYNRSSLHLL